MPSANEWERRFGARRRAADKKLLADLERQIGAEEKAAEEARLTIARAFGRPLARDRN